MARPSLYDTQYDVEPLHALYGTPKHAYALLNLSRHVPWREFYRFWSTGTARRSTGDLILAAHRAWCERGVTGPDAREFHLADNVVDLLAYASS